MATAPPVTVEWQGFEPPTKKSAAGCVTIGPWFFAAVLRIPTAWSLLTTNIMPWDDIWDHNLALFYANDPQKGGYTTPAPALDLTTSVRGDWYFTKGSVTGAPLPDPPPPSGGSHDPPPPPPAQANFPLALAAHARSTGSSPRACPDVRFLGVAGGIRGDSGVHVHWRSPGVLVSALPNTAKAAPFSVSGCPRLPAWTRRFWGPGVHSHRGGCLHIIQLRKFVHSFSGLCPQRGQPSSQLDPHRMESMANRPFLTSLTFNSAKVSRSPAKPRVSEASSGRGISRSSPAGPA